MELYISIAIVAIIAIFIAKEVIHPEGAGTKTKTASPTPAAPPAPQPQTAPKRAKSEYFPVAGVYYHEDNLKQLLEPNDEYSRPASELKADYYDGDKIYRREVIPSSVVLVPEPGNEHDPNAIRVDLDGLTVGYIKKTMTARVRELLDAGPAAIRATSEGGPYKEIVEDDDGKKTIEQGEEDYWVTVIITPK